MLDFTKNFDVLEKIVLNYILDTGMVGDVVDENNTPIDRNRLTLTIEKHYFRDPVIHDIFDVVKKHQHEYGKIPSRHDVWSELELNNTHIDKEEFDTILSYDLSTHNKKLLYKYIRGFVLMLNLNSGLQKMMLHLKSSMIDFNKTDEIYEYVRGETHDFLQMDISESDDGLDIFDPMAHIQPIKSTRPTGFPFFDKVLGGGWEKKTLICFQGRPKVGKSLILSNVAVRACWTGSNVAVITVELGDRKYVKRLGSNLMSIPYEKYKKFVDEDSVSEIAERANALREDKKHKPGHMLIKEYPTGVPSSIDIENYLLKEQKKRGVRFDVVVVDYINLLRPYKSDSTLYEKIKSIAQELRAIAQRNDWTVVTATQVKVHDYHSDLRLDSASESSGLVATVDSLFGIMGEPGGSQVTIKNIANRDEGYMESYKKFNKVWEFFRIQEDNTDDGEYWSDEPGKIESQLDDMYKSLGIGGESMNPTIENPRPESDKPSEDKSVESMDELTNEQVLTPNTEFDNMKASEAVYGGDHDDILGDISVDIEPTDNQETQPETDIDYNDLMNSI